MGMMTCITADMVSYTNYADAGVTSVVQSYKVSLKNLSDVAQDVTVTILPGTWVLSQNSAGAGNGIPFVLRPTREVTSPHNIPVHLPAHGQGSTTITFGSTDTAYSIDAIDGSNVDCSGAPQVCLRQESSLILRISVAQDRGAILANLTATAHRCSGSKDHYLQPPIAFQINGGRPF